jgi:hypothetical protein
VKFKTKTYPTINFRGCIYLVVATMPDGRIKPVAAVDERSKADKTCAAFHTIWSDVVDKVEIFNVYFEWSSRDR